MKIKTFKIPGPILLTPRVFEDKRGYFLESFRESVLIDAIGEPIRFLQDNQSLSVEMGTVRGLHYQSPPYAQAKLVRCLSGSIIDIIVDIREGSPTFGQHLSVELSGENHRQLFVPAGFLHGFSTQAPNSLVSYKVTNYYSAELDGQVLWNSPSLGLDWHLPADGIVVSEKDQAAPKFSEWKTPFKF